MVFGDLKNYYYHYKFLLVELQSRNVNILKANKVSSMLEASQVEEKIASLQQILLNKED